MESNIKGLVAAGHEMASELKAECGAVDMRSVAKLISDLATQLEVQLVRANALAEDQQKTIESIKQDDAAVKLAHEKFSALAAENAGLKSAHPQPFGPGERGYCANGKRIMFREYDRLIITKGYPKRDDSSRRIDIPYGGYEIKTITHPHFGDKPVKVFVIKVNIDG